MSAHAFSGGPGSGSATALIHPCGWDEPFDEADTAAYHARYPVSFADTTGEAARDASGTAVISSGALVCAPGVGEGWRVRQFDNSDGVWAQIDVAFSTAFNTSVNAIPWGMSIVNNAVPVPGLPQASANIGYIRNPNVSGNPFTFTLLLYNADNSPVYAYDGLLESGSHSIVLGAFGLTAATYRGIIWVDGAQVLTADATRPVNDSFTIHEQYFRNVIASVTNNSGSCTISVARFRVTCGTLASNPFGVTL